MFRSELALQGQPGAAAEGVAGLLQPRRGGLRRAAGADDARGGRGGQVRGQPEVVGGAGASDHPGISVQ